MEAWITLVPGCFSVSDSGTDKAYACFHISLLTNDHSALQDLTGI